MKDESVIEKLIKRIFLTAWDYWTPDFVEALDFRTTPAAFDDSRAHGHSRTSIILKFPDSLHDIELKNG